MTPEQIIRESMITGDFTKVFEGIMEAFLQFHTVMLIYTVILIFITWNILELIKQFIIMIFKVVENNMKIENEKKLEKEEKDYKNKSKNNLEVIENEFREYIEKK